MRFPLTSSDLNRMEASKPAAIVRPAEVKNCAFYEGKLSQCEVDYDMWLDEFKTSGTWREKYKTWDACCELYLDKTKRAVDKRIQKHKMGTKVPEVADKSDTKEQKALSQVEEAREEEPEKAEVKTAQQSIADTAAKNELQKAKENGKPKNQLAAWGKTEDCFGALVRSVDDVHRSCPNHFRHDQVLKLLSSALTFFQEWRKSVK